MREFIHANCNSFHNHSLICRRDGCADLPPLSRSRLAALALAKERWNEERSTRVPLVTSNSPKSGGVSMTNQNDRTSWCIFGDGRATQSAKCGNRTAAIIACTRRRASRQANCTCAYVPPTGHPIDHAIQKGSHPSRSGACASRPYFVSPCNTS